ncbi:MAG: hypothetical protein ACTSU2_03760 [Promethearchaeota archaeon]
MNMEKGQSDYNLNRDGNSVSVVKVQKNPDMTEFEIINLLKNVNRPMRFHQVQKALNYTSGKLQNAIKRMERKGLIVKKKVPLSPEESRLSSGRTHVTKIFYKDFPTDVMIPIRLDETTAAIISEIGKVAPEYGTLDSIIKNALITYFKKIPAKVKLRAIEQAVEDGIITKEKGDALLGRR